MMRKIEVQIGIPDISAACGLCTMQTKFTLAALTMGALLLAAAGCSRSEREWKEAVKENASASYQSYLAAFPHGKHAAEARQKLDEIKEAQQRVATEPIDTTIAVWMTGVAAQLSAPCEVSQRLRALIKKYDAETVMGFVGAGTTIQYKRKGLAIELTDDWGIPVHVSTTKIPIVKFRKGEVGLEDGEICVKDGTEALVADKAYTFTNHQWVIQ
jgi:hypothetical protein